MDVAKVTQVLDLGDGVGGVVAEDEVGTFGVGVEEFAVGGGCWVCLGVRW